MNNKRFYNMVKQSNNSLDIDIYGDIGGWYYENTIESLSEQIKRMDDINEINVYINSYGGELAEGLAIYNALKQHEATVNTYIMGFACSSASLIFMSGDNRYISKASMLMIHNAISSCCGNSADMRAMAETLDKLNKAICNVYLDSVNISAEDIQNLLDEESFLGYEEAIEYGFATELFNDTKEELYSNNALKTICNILTNNFTDKRENNIINTVNTDVSNVEESKDEDEKEDEPSQEETTEETTEEEKEEEKEEKEENKKETTNKVDYISNLLKMFK